MLQLPQTGWDGAPFVSVRSRVSPTNNNLPLQIPIHPPKSASQHPGGGAYYFAKKSINADRAHRHSEAQRRKEEAHQKEQMEKASSSARSPAPTSSQTATGSSIPSTTSQTISSSAGMGSAQAVPAKVTGSNADDAACPSLEAGHDPAPTRHEPETARERIEEKGKYEAAEPFRSRKGNRFS
ncbi:hypothetical protein AJ79_04602 [Helicocarpus griseus UAMH5409]|uniref:Uncharacterized protein n=1 Tax=Helicocarpus griseus UAMH5409 TaxID=1447875 RepID=A0A2B7XSE9_9EURO|nr:hypothetical protein AJ79_04602 [Helicocarpus griseus UAMH5409]